MPPPRTRLLVVSGGVIGTVLRAAVGSVPSGAFPWPTLMVNLIGTAVLGLLIGRMLARPSLSRWIPFVGVGVLGALTTFGTLSVQIVDLVTSGRPLVAVAYAGVSVGLGGVLGLTCVRLGEASR